MQKRHLSFVFIVLIVSILLNSGCINFISDTSTTYQSQPTSVRYEIRYGYTVHCKNAGEYEIRYRCDKPGVLRGAVSSLQILYPHEYQDILVANNSVLFWNISGMNANTYELGVSATVSAENVLVSDLSGISALTVEDIDSLHPDVVSAYCHGQTVDGVAYIDTDNSDIVQTANQIKERAGSSNAFVLAQGLFSWLKETTRYKVHGDDTGAQPAATTFQKKTGDCDDLSFLYLSLCRSVGIPARLIRGYLLDNLAGTPTVEPHAWVEVYIGGTLGNNGWIPVECAGGSTAIQTEIHQNFGVEDVAHLRLFVDEGSNESLNISFSSISWTYSSGTEISAASFVEIDNYVILESKQLVVSKDGIRSYKSTS